MRSYGDTRGLWLCTRYRDRLGYEGESCLLVYDDESFDDSLVSGDIKEVFERRASTANIYIVAPFLANDRCRAAFSGGAAVQRARSYLDGRLGNIYLLELTDAQAGDGRLQIDATAMGWDPHGDDSGQTTFDAAVKLPDELREGWLFDLFDASEGLLTAPPGVHFRKTSSKHTTKFLRAANALMTTAACALLAMFSLAAMRKAQPRQIFVDTAPLLSVALAMMRIARSHGVWRLDVPAKTFSSYGGLSRIGRLASSDIVLISASTSGSLAKEVVALGASQHSIVTLYFLRSSDTSDRPNAVLCNLTAEPARLFGYQAVQNFAASKCQLCDEDHFLADLEGDQFLLQRRPIKSLRVLKASQPDDAGDTVEEIARMGLVQVSVRPAADQAGLVTVDGEGVLTCPPIRNDVIRLLRRYSPHPLGLVIRVDISAAAFGALVVDAGLNAFAHVPQIDWSELQARSPLKNGEGALVVFGCLDNHSRARSINAFLRRLICDGNVAYVAGLTLAESAVEYRSLETFLQYGARGPETFLYRTARRLALPPLRADSTAWQAESNLLDRLASISGALPPGLDARRNWLASTSEAQDGIFFSADRPALAIQRDFVFLDTAGAKLDHISQADIFFVVLNALCCARFDNRPLDAKRVALPGAPVQWSQSVYGQVLLSPANFRDYNDAILKAAFLRAAHRSELMYGVDERSSEEMDHVIRAELAAWATGAGGALPEMLVALASGRLTLTERHTASLGAHFHASKLPPDLIALADEIN